MRRSLLPAVALAACTGKPVDDIDNDGFAITDGDCNDSDPLIHPDAAEICDAIDNNCNGVADEDGWEGAPIWYADVDGDSHGDPTVFVASCSQPDGYSADTLDCDDSDHTVYAGADEFCDGVDNDCDGNIDEGTAIDVTTFYADKDGDSYGLLSEPMIACTAPSGYVDNAEDCNDLYAIISPDAEEVCDGVDNDCDGTIDDDDDSLTSALTWYLDEDFDGFGIGGSTLSACLSPYGYAAQPGDCDDDTWSTNPAADELCGDEADNNCDGDIDEESAPEHVSWYIDADTDGFGDDSLPSLLQCSQPAGYTAHPGDCDDDDLAINPQAAEIWYDGIDADCDGASDYDADADGYEAESYGGEDCDDAINIVHPGHIEVCGDGLDNNCDDDTDPCRIDAILYGSAADDFLGSALDNAGDWDGDGYSDLILGAPGHDGTGTDMGGVYVVGGPITGSSDVSTTSTVYFYGEQSNDYLGTAVAGLGDTDDDAYSEILMGAPGYDAAGGGATDAGAAYLHYGPEFGSKSLAASLDVRLSGVAAYDHAGEALSTAGDFNDDGEMDFIIGAPLNDASAVNSGAAYLLLGPVNASAALSAADVIFAGTAINEWAGSSLSGGGDIDGDGYDDVAIGAPNYSVGGFAIGGVFLVYGQSAPAAAYSLIYADAILQGSAAGDLTGASVSVGGDTNGDGYDDLLLGAPNDAMGSGAAYLFHGPLNGAISVATADAIFTTFDASAELGFSVDIGGDVDDDGRDDLIIGAPGSQLGGADRTGAAYVVLAPMIGGISVESVSGAQAGQNFGDALGTSVSLIGDINLDGYEDFAAGAPYNDDNQPNGGGIWLSLGGGF